MAIGMYLREIGRGKDGARGLSRAQATDLWSQLLDGEVSDVACIERGGRSFIDVRAGVAAQLAGLAIDSRHVTICTHESPHLFSYRRDTVTGRQGMIIRQ